ncbi:diaminopimelate epimerase [Luteimonas sp. e5]
MTRPPPPEVARLRFDKMHGAGNDFVVLDLRDGQAAPDAALCRHLADRHRGVGCDQILTIEPPRHADAHARYRIWNADGSVAGQCGNGARCVAEWLARHDGLHDAGLCLESPAGLHQATRVDAGRWRIGMGRPRFAPAHIPLHGFEHEQAFYTLLVEGDELRFGAVSMGNPHALIEVEDLATTDVAGIARQLQQSACFPESVNVGFVQVLAPGRVRLRVYERGAGETLACGSGACAAAAILIRRGHPARRIRVELPGGELEIDWSDEDAGIAMAGPAQFVFAGVIDASGSGAP